MKKIFLAIAVALFGMSLAHAQPTDILIDIDRGRTEGIFTKSPVFQRAILIKPGRPTDTAVLYFRGTPGIARIQSLEDKKGMAGLINFMRMNQRLFLQQGIALVIMDCPTDQWGAPGPIPTGCHDNYRSSKEHADDVRSVIAKLKGEHGISNIYVMGHSLGTISSRWLARNLGNEISGSIHSASMNVPNPGGYASSFWNFRYDTITAPVLHIHNENDACRGTPYSMVKEYAGENLVTVRGGVPEGDPCGGGHLHSYQGREEIVVRSIVDWIKTRKLDRLIGE